MLSSRFQSQLFGSSCMGPFPDFTFCLLLVHDMVLFVLIVVGFLFIPRADGVLVLTKTDHSLSIHILL